MVKEKFEQSFHLKLLNRPIWALSEYRIYVETWLLTSNLAIQKRHCVKLQYQYTWILLKTDPLGTGFTLSSPGAL